MKLFSFLVSFLLFNGHSFYYYDSPSTLIGKFWIENNQIVFFLKNGINTYDIDSNTISICELEYDYNMYENLYVEKLKDNLYFFDKEGGFVFKLVNDKLFRIDNSYKHRLHNGSLNFNYNNIHYRFGGYGFFERSRSLVYFNDLNKEWELKSNFEEYLKKGRSGFTFHELSQNSLTVFGGDTSSSNGYDHDYSSEILKINLENNSIKILGTLNDNFPKRFRNYINSPNYIYLLKSPSLLYIYDRINKVFIKKQIDFKPQLLIGIIQNKLFYISNQTYNPNEFFIQSISIKEILNNTDDERLSIFNTLYFYPSLTFFIALLLFILLLSQNKSKREIILSENKIIDKDGIEILLNNEQINFLNFLKGENEKSNLEVLNFFSNNHLNLGHQNRLKNKFIKSINDIFMSRTGIKIILIKKNINDKRSTSYKLNL